MDKLAPGSLRKDEIGVLSIRAMLRHLHAVSKDLSKIETLFHASDNPLSEERLDEVGLGAILCESTRPIPASVHWYDLLLEYAVVLK